MTVLVRTTKAKAVVAGIGSTVTAIAVALPVLADVLKDDAVDSGEIATLVTVAVTLISTVYAVWKVPNKPVYHEGGPVNRI